MKEAKEGVANSFKTIIGGTSGGMIFKGDAFLDKEIEWHEQNENPSKIRQTSDALLIIIYPLNANYVRRNYYDITQRSKENPNGLRIRKDIFLQPGDDNYIPSNKPILSFAAWTPIGGPTYDVGTNALIKQHDDIRQIGTEQVDEDEHHE